MTQFCKSTASAIRFCRAKARNNTFLPSSEAVLHRWNRLLREPPEPSPEQSQLLHRRAAPEPVTCPICLLTFQDHAILKFHHTKVHETRTKEEQQVHKQVMRTRTEAHLKYPKVLCGRHADVSHVWT